MRLVLLLSMIFVAVVSPLAADNAGYAIQELGSISGVAGCTASGVNDRAEVVGWFVDAEHKCRAFYWSEKTGMTELKMPDGYMNSYACAINNDGLIAGFATGPRGASKACLWRADKGLVQLGPNYSDLKSINEMGQGGGTVGTNAAMFDKGLEAKPNVDGMGIGINNLGEMVGVSFNQQRKFYESFFWSAKAGKVDLGPGSVKDVNDSGKIVGYAANGQATVWDRNGSSRSLPVPKGHEMASAEAVNNAGQVAGSLLGVAVVWQPDDEVTELPNLKPDAESYAKAISESGLVAGEVIDNAGRLHAVLWQQKSERGDEEGGE